MFGCAFQGVVSGTLLVTPNAIMFDPNVSDTLVIEHGADMYGKKSTSIVLYIKCSSKDEFFSNNNFYEKILSRNGSKDSCTLTFVSTSVQCE